MMFRKTLVIFIFYFINYFDNSMSQSRPQNSLSNDHEDDPISQNQFDYQTPEGPNKPRSRLPGRPRGRGRPKANLKVINKKKTSEEDVQEEQPKPKQKVNVHKQENTIEPYIRIVDYLKKIDCDEASFQNKMNPFHSLTATCFWYMVSAEYYSYDFFSKNNPLQAANQVLNRVSKLPIQMTTRFMKNTRQGTLLEFQTEEVKKQAENLTEFLSHLIPSPLVQNKFQNIQKKLSLSTVTEDNQFISSTRALLFNYIKNKIQKSQKWASTLKGRLEILNDLKPKLIAKRVPLSFDENKEGIIDASQLDILSRQVKKNKILKKKDEKSNEPAFENLNHTQEMIDNKNSSDSKSSNFNPEENMELEVNGMEEQGKDQSKNKDSKQIQEQKDEIDGQNSQSEVSKLIQKGMTSDEVLLSSILNLPLDKVISILESSIPKVQLPAIYPPFMSIPKSDPLQFVFQLHQEQQKYLEYMKEYKKKMYHNKIRKSQVLIQEEERQTQFQDAKCQICTDGDYTEDNLIVFCSTCNISLHQRCVGLAKVPAQSWVCDVCLAFGPAGINLPCPLCNVKGGAMKRTNIHIDSNLWKQTNPSFYQYSKRCPYNKQKQEYINPHKIGHEDHQISYQNEPKEEKEELYYDYFNKSTYTQDQPVCHYVWVHYVCSIWVPECYFEQKNGAINVKGIQNIEKKRYKHECFVCKKSKAGACVKCQDPDCKKYYHPECARKKKVYMEQLNLQKIKYLIFCEEHQPLKITRQIEYKKKKNRDEIIKFARMIEKYIETYKIAIFPFKLMKIIPTKSFIQTFEAQEKEEEEENKVELIRQTDEEFIKEIIIKLSKLKKISFTVQKTQTGLKIVDVYQPSRRQMRKCLNKYDDFWHTIQNGENADQNCKRYDRIIKENQFLKDKMETFLNGGSLAGSAKQAGKGSQKSKKGKARGKNAKQQVETLIQEEGGIFCICRKPYENQLDMIQCQICGEWYHYKCIGFIGDQVDAQSLEFHCMKCMKFQTQQEKRPRLQKCIHLFASDSLYLNYSPPTPKLMSEEDPVEMKQALGLESEKSKQNLFESHDKEINSIKELNVIEQLGQRHKIDGCQNVSVREITDKKIDEESQHLQRGDEVINMKITAQTELGIEETKKSQALISEFLGAKMVKQKPQNKKSSSVANNLTSIKERITELERSVLQKEYNNNKK